MAQKYFDSVATVLSRAFKLPLLAIILTGLWTNHENRRDEAPPIYFSFLALGLLKALLYEFNKKAKHYATLPQDILHEFFENFAIFSFAMNRVFQLTKTPTYILSFFVALASAQNEFDEYLLHDKHSKSGNYTLLLRSLLRSVILISLFVVINDFEEDPLISIHAQRTTFAVYFSFDVLLHKLLHFKASLARFNAIEKAETVAYEFFSRLFLNFETIMLLVISLYGADEFPNALYTPAGLMSPLLAILSAYEQACLKPYYYGAGDLTASDNDKNDNRIAHADDKYRTPYQPLEVEHEQKPEGSWFAFFKDVIHNETSKRLEALNEYYLTFQR